MRVISWLRRLTVLPRVCGAASLFAFVFVVTAAADTTPSVGLAHRRGLTPIVGLAPVPAVRHAATSLMVHDFPAGVYIPTHQSTRADDSDAIQDDAPPIGLADPCGHSPVLEPLGTLSAHHVIAHSHAGENRRSPRGPPVTS